MHEKYGYQIIPKYLTLLGDPVEAFTVQGNLQAVLQHPALKHAPKCYISSEPREPREINVTFPGGSLRDALSCVAHNTTGEDVYIFYNGGWQMYLSNIDPKDLHKKESTTKIRIRYDVKEGEPTAHDLVESLCYWNYEKVKGDWTIQSFVKYSDRAFDGSGQCRVCVDFLRSLLARDPEGMQECVPETGLLCKGRQILSDDMAKLVKDLAKDLEGMELGDIMDVPATRDKSWKYTALPNGKMQASIPSKLTTGPLQGSLIFICEKRPQSNPNDKPPKYFVVEVK